MKEKVYIASDHGGFNLKQAMMNMCVDHVEWIDLGPEDDNRVDYPVYADKVADVLKDAPEGQKAVLVCGSGIGVSIAANRYRWVRAALCTSEEMAHLSRAHNNANVLVLGGRLIDEEMAEKCLNAFLNTPFEGGRHTARIAMMTD